MANGDPLRLVVFDMDGTLIDSQHHIIASMTRAFSANGLPAPDPAAVRAGVGLPLEAIFRSLLPGHGPALYGKLAEDYRDDHRSRLDRGERQEPLMPGAREVIERLDAAGYLIALATGKGTRGARHALEVHGLIDYFVTIQTADTAPGKPHPGMLLQAMDEAGVEASATIMVGDTVYDLETARNASVASVAVTWGYHERDALYSYGADALIDHFDDLDAAVERLLKNG
ncbi:HAD-IA family hydrolase [Nisaea acidiphila]|uniref:HAD-IA family hydrolase n=1 Tax=Nisaea acidiphila TaxID=1862145 RepID=A0A9J7AMK6_9PROT|nr:HAD-IA family hydrolase [Nisaea acidiphila]UUX48688.1 HAD-IA family hydrolase [Nisaea acidiphila]